MSVENASSIQKVDSPDSIVACQQDAADFFDSIVLNPLAPARPATELVAGGDRGDGFRQLAPIVEQIKNFVSALHQLSNECWATTLQKDNILFSFDHWQSLTY